MLKPFAELGAAVEKLWKEHGRKEEAFGKWTHERVLYDVVRAIRLYRPLVLTSTWVGGVTDGHGHHQVSGQITQEAFVAAGDPKVFPERTSAWDFTSIRTTSA